MGLTRHDDWRSRLMAYVAGVAGKPFRWGKLDCALFTAGAVQAMTGEDFARGWRGKYRSLRAASEALHDAGHEDHVAYAASMLPEVPPAFAQVGDVAVVPGDIDEALGIVQGPHVWVMRPDGLGTVPLTAAVRAFRV